MAERDERIVADLLPEEFVRGCDGAGLDGYLETIAFTDRRRRSQAGVL